MHGGIEIPVQGTVKLDYNPQSKAAIGKYDALALQLYNKESVDGKFDASKPLDLRLRLEYCAVCAIILAN